MDGDETPSQVAQGELGALKLARRQFTEALDTLLRAGYWLDAAYVAERVLTADELTRYVDRSWKEKPPPDWDHNRGCVWQAAVCDLKFQIRYVLARRLARAGRWKEARDYYPAALLVTLDEYREALRKGRDEALVPARRAEHLWNAAALARQQGMELLGTEVEPDWRSVQGVFDLEHNAEARFGSEIAAVLRASAEERRRAEAHVPDPDKRFHYRYLAAQHALEAARLLPRNSDRAARWLVTAGHWIQKRDPQAADPLYKTLVRQHGRTELGREADRLRWFPALPDEEAEDKEGKS